MKDLGRTPSGDWLVQMTNDEHTALGHLAVAMEGRGLDGIRTLRPIPLETDQAAVFELISEFAIGRMLMNDVAEVVQGMVGLLSTKLEGEHDE